MGISLWTVIVIIFAVGVACTVIYYLAKWFGVPQYAYWGYIAVAVITIVYVANHTGIVGLLQSIRI